MGSCLICQLCVRAYAAKALGLGIVSPPAYLSLAVPISLENFTGVNYASEGARIWDFFYAVSHLIRSDCQDHLLLPMR